MKKAMVCVGLLAASSCFGWFHLEGPEVTIEPFRDHGDGTYLCSVEPEQVLVAGPTFPTTQTA